MQTDRKPPATQLLTIEMVLTKFPDGARPSARLVKEVAQRLGIGRHWGRTYYLTETEADALLLAGSKVKKDHSVRPIRPRPMWQLPKSGSAVERALELNKRLADAERRARAKGR